MSAASRASIQAGDAFAADRLIRDVLRRASRELAIIDAYVGTNLFDYLDDLAAVPGLRILTSDAINAATRTTYAAFRKKHGQVEMRIAAPGVLHDRFVLWDKVAGATFGHSLKDLGKKDAQVTWLKDAAEQWRLFETRWAAATPA